MKKLVTAILLMCSGALAYAQANIAGTLYASNFAQWSVRPGDRGPFSWSDPSACTVNSGGISFIPFKAGTPITVVDANPANTETVTITSFTVGTGGCALSAPFTHQHVSFVITTGTAGLQDAINYASAGQYTVLVTSDWVRAGGITAMLTSASGGTNVGIIDQRTATAVPYLWNGSAYVANPYAGGGGAVISFNGRAGVVVPVSGDYNYTQIGGSLNLATEVTGLLGTANGGNGSASPGLVAGSNITITGSWPNQTITSTGGGGGLPSGTGIVQVISGTGSVATGAQIASAIGSNAVQQATHALGLNRYVYLSDYANGSPTPTCNTNVWPHTGCVDETTQIQAAWNATAALHAMLYCDSPIAGNTYFASHIYIPEGTAGITGSGFQYNNGGCTFSLIPGTNGDFITTDPALSSTNYIDEVTFENWAIQGDGTFTSNTGSGLVFNAIVGERTQLNRVTVGPFPNHGIVMAVGSDPVEWIDIAMGGNGYAASTPATGSGLYINGPYGRVDIYGLSLDDNKNCGVYIAEGLTYTNASQLIFRATKGENRSDNSYQPGQNYAFCINGSNNTPIIIDGVSLKSIDPNPSTTVSVVRSGCNGTTCTVVVTWPPNFLGYGYLAEPRVGANIQLSGLTPSDLNQIGVVTAVSGQSNPAVNQTITFTQTTAGSNETASVQGYVQWNSTANAVVQMTSGSANVKINNWSVEGGANGIGPRGYANLINDNGTLTALGQGAFGNTGNEGINTYYFDGGAICTDTVCQGSLGNQFLATYQMPGDTAPRAGFTGSSFVMGTGSATPNLIFNYGVDIYSQPVLELSSNGGAAGTAGIQAHSLYTDGFEDLNFGTSPYTGTWAVGYADGALKPGNCGSCFIGEFAGPVGSVITKLVNEVVGSPIAAAATIAPIDGITHITGTAAPITTITLPYTGFTGCIHLWPDAGWTLATGGNIITASTATVNRIMDVCYDGSHWAPSY